ncbi:PTS fructose transporter subunit IIABC [Macrococcus equipercicus]|uniref:Fructose-specific PTS transporter subunit EIIC n=1 Tax=Macrococcus equipercicus TaxID=69967 RepID=A0A9Q9BPH2_9STAP|nr:PTS fructose transporter subunit IIABC [Macrococcus equipercicus]UTH14295.1 fructose-specific PTS transporter subunit EIIC [Macrococcus equipercicus]
MRITDLLTASTIALDLRASSKDAVINELVDTLWSAGKLNDKEKYHAAIHAREAQSTTGIGEGIAIPHAKTDAVKTPAIAFGKSKPGVDYQSLDGTPAHLFFMIAAPAGGAQTHLDALAKLSGMLMNEDVRRQLLDARSKEEVLAIIDAHDEPEERHKEAAVVAAPTQEPDENLILAVTACPTGIAHTYMAADSLKNKAARMGVPIKVETNGSGGVKNKLTADEIRRAKGIIVAADVNVDTARFHGKNVVMVPVADGIKRPEELITMAQDESRPKFVAKGGAGTSSTGSEKTGFYKHLMNGVSNMLPFVVAGGILMAIAFMFGITSFDPTKSDYNPFAQALWAIGNGSAFALMIPILAGFIAMSIADRPGLAPGMVGGMLAMSGGSGFLGGLIAGFLAGYLVQGIKKLLSFLPRALEGTKPTLLYPLLGVLSTGLIMYYIINPPTKWLNDWMNTTLSGMNGANIVLLGLILGGMMAIDMGGPINKASYAFGIAAIAGNNYAPITAAMIGGMVPPLAIAVSMMLFKRKYTKTQRGSIVSNLIMGASFITEGAIPFAAADPLRVIPSMIAGSATAGAMAMAFGCRIPAPHGGLWVAGLDKGHLFGFLVSLVVGTLISAVIYGLIKPKLSEEELAQEMDTERAAQA